MDRIVPEVKVLQSLRRWLRLQHGVTSPAQLARAVLGDVVGLQTREAGQEVVVPLVITRKLALAAQP